MSKSIFLLATTMLFISFSYAKIWRVNNNPGIVADFNAIQAAHDGAAPGDTIHVEGSPNSYGALTCTKKLAIIGPGFFLDENPGLQAFFQTAKVESFNYNEGSAGSVVMGMDFRTSNIAIFSNDIIIRRNKFTSPSGTTPDYQTGGILLYYLSGNSAIPVSNIIIAQNYGVRIDINYASTGVLINNNFIAFHAYVGDQTTGYALDLNVNAVVLIQNNIFRRGTIRTYNSTITNNIMYAGALEGTGNLVSNNIASGTQFGNADGNQTGIDMNTVFDATGSTDAYWKLKPGSPAIGAGFGSTTQNPVDCGIYSGYSPYVLSGLPPVPSVYFFSNQPVGSSNDPIDVTIKVKSNN